MEIPPSIDRALAAFANAAKRVPAYQALLGEAGVRWQEVQTLGAFQRLPVLEKRNTFQRFPLQQLCLDGDLGQPGHVLTSSGHSGIFAFGLTDAAALPATSKWIDDALDIVFAVRSKPTLLINCLPMGVKVHTQACALAETSVRPDMAVGLVNTLGHHFTQIILVGEAAFVKHVLEMGCVQGVNWKNHTVYVILGEEPLAENARRYLSKKLGHDLRHPEKGMVFSSMGVAELGLNLFFEVPPVAPLVLLRHSLHTNVALRESVLGPVDSVPALFTFDPGRVFVEFDSAHRLIVTMLDQALRIPLIRYATGDRGQFLMLGSHLRPALEALGLPWQPLASLPILAIQGRGEHASAGTGRIYPEAVKEGIYHDSSLAEQTTANFRLVSGASVATIRIQLSPGIIPTPSMQDGFRAAIAHYVKSPFTVICEHYEQFGSGMALDYERKFQYLGP